jgi:predicted negative regulator of RcsB-dependent stress response
VNDLSEKEQLDEMRAWWSENGRFVITGVVLGVAIIFGFNQWRSSIENAQTEASNLYEEVMTAVGNGDTDAAEVAANNLFDNYERTVYPEQTRLALARLYMDKGRDQDAVEVLRELIVEEDESELQLVGRLRLAKVLLYQNKADEVIELMEGRNEGGFAARYSEILGDAYAAKGDYAAAQTAYLAALTEDRAVQTIDNNLIQLKINDLPDLNEVAATAEALEAAIEAGDVAEESTDAPVAVEEPEAAPDMAEDADPEAETEQ